MLEKEAAAAQNVKCRINRHLILQAIASAQHLLSLYKNIPPNGIAFFCGGEENHRFALEPPHQPIMKNSYLCDKIFHVDLIRLLFDSQETIGYIIVHGDDALFAIVSGTKITRLGTTVGHLQNDTRRGGQSAPRIGRIAEGKRDNYAKRIGERAWDLFGPNSGRKWITLFSVVLLESSPGF